MILALVAAPLMMLGRPVAALGGLFGRRVSRRARAANGAMPLTASGVFALLLWFWHMPVPYAATFSNDAVYWSMHISLFGSALWLWGGLLSRAPSHALYVVGAGVISSVQMGFLGALVTFAPRALYAPHLLTASAWGFTPLQDQQLGGAIMWVPGCVVFFAVAMLVLWQMLAQAAWAAPSRLSPR